MSDTPDDGPPILRPIPRRPFNLNIREPTPPGEEANNDDEGSSSPSSPPSPLRPSNRSNPPLALNLESLNSRLLHDPSINRSSSSNVALATPGSDAGPGAGGGNASSSISRAQSILNLTSSTLMGIYTPTTYGQDRMSSLLSDGKDGGTGTPWGTGAETPARLHDIEDGDEEDALSSDNEDADDDETEGEREMRRRRRSSLHAAEVMGRRRASLLMQARPHTLQQQQQQPPPLLSSVATLPALALRLAPRALLLSALGVLYGVLVARVLDRFRPIMGAPTTSTYDWRYMAFWGVSGVALGGLLPWFDGVWEGAFGASGGDGRLHDESAVVVEQPQQRRQRRRPGRRSVGGGLSGKGQQQQQQQEGVGEGAAVPGPDWSLAVRGIGAFAGIAFAIRKLAWDSTTQVSVTLALVNPVLWYLIDRSVPGLLMAGAVGIAGSAIFMAPLASPSVPFATTLSPWAYLLNNGGEDWNRQQQQQSFNESSSSSYHDDNSPLRLFNGGGGLGGASAGGGGSGSGRHHLESAVWMLSVLFCCCVCFGNIGRWLALMSRNNNGSNRPRSGSVSGAANGFAKGGR